MATALVTGGAGYIGSHACVELLAAGWDVVVVDNLSNASQAAVERVRELAPGALRFHRVDLLDGPGLDRVLGGQRVDAIVHFAGLKAVGESVAEPLRYAVAEPVGIAVAQSVRVPVAEPVGFAESVAIGVTGIVAEPVGLAERVAERRAVADPDVS